MIAGGVSIDLFALIIGLRKGWGFWDFCWLGTDTAIWEGILR